MNHPSRSHRHRRVNLNLLILDDLYDGSEIFSSWDGWAIACLTREGEFRRFESVEEDIDLEDRCFRLTRDLKVREIDQPDS